MKKFHEILVSLREKTGLNQTQLGEILGVKRNTLSNYESGLTEPKFSTLVSMSKYFGVSIDYLLGNLSEEEMNKEMVKNGNLNSNPNGNPSTIQASEPMAKYKPRDILQPVEIIVTTVDIKGNPIVPVVNHRAAANYISGYQSTEFFENLDYWSIPSYLTKGAEARAWIVKGDSMTPNYEDGSIVFTRLVEKEDWIGLDDREVVVVISETKGVQIKRVLNRLSKYGFLRFRSDNRSHSSFNLNPEEIIQIWRGFAHLKFDLSNPNDTVYKNLDELREGLEELTLEVQRLKESKR